jgi:phenylacetate-CoA ligase
MRDTAREMGLDPRRDLHYRVGFSTAEALTTGLRRDLEDMFGIELFDHCGEAQIGPLAGECRLHDGMHLHARDLFCEFLNPDSGEPAEPGEIGELVATQLGPRALPLVRYAPGDAFRLLLGQCPCGDPSLRLVFVGQVGAIKKVKGVLVHPAQVHKVTSLFPEIGRFQIVVEHPDHARYDRATLRAGILQAPTDPEALKRSLAEQLKATVLIQMEVELVPDADIPETAGPPRFTDCFVDHRQAKAR